VGCSHFPSSFCSKIRAGGLRYFDKGISTNVPYTICVANGCVAATVADPGFVRSLESGRTLLLEGVNANVVTVTSTVPLDNFAEVARKNDLGGVRENLSSMPPEKFAD
jgi:invasion protein IalB